MGRKDGGDKVCGFGWCNRSNNVFSTNCHNAGQRHGQTFDSKENYCKNVDGLLLFNKHPNSVISLLTISEEYEDGVWSFLKISLVVYLIVNHLIDLSNSVFTDLVGKSS